MTTGHVVMEQRVPLTRNGAIRYNDNPLAGWSSLAARRAHNPKVAGSNPAPATKYSRACSDASPFNLRGVTFLCLRFLNQRHAKHTDARQKAPSDPRRDAHNVAP